MTEPKCWSIYDPDEYRREKIVGVKKHFNEVLIDQIPTLRDLERVIDILCLCQNPYDGHNSTGALILEQIPELRNQLLNNKDWHKIANEQKLNAFGKQNQQLSEKRMGNVLEMLDLICNLEAESALEDHIESSKKALTKVEKIWIEARRKSSDSSIWNRVLDFTIELDSTSPSEVITTHSKSGTHYGRRYKLLALKKPLREPLPARGKVIVTFRDKSSEARLNLPAPSVKSETGLAPNCTHYLTPMCLSIKGALADGWIFIDRSLCSSTEAPKNGG